MLTDRLHLRRRVVVKESSVHGLGVFARVDIETGELIGEYRGARLSWDAAQEQYGEAGSPGHTFFFDVGDGTVIDGDRGGNSTRWINHGCVPNCEAVDVDGRIYIEAASPIRSGDELLLDYQLVVDDPDEPGIHELYRCACRAASCRGSMLSSHSLVLEH